MTKSNETKQDYHYFAAHARGVVKGEKLSDVLARVRKEIVPKDSQLKGVFAGAFMTRVPAPIDTAYKVHIYMPQVTNSQLLFFVQSDGTIIGTEELNVNED